MRIFRTCRVMNIPTVAIYTHVDRGALHVRYAEEAYCISEDEADTSYLKPDLILEIAKKTGAAIHPGYGFLSENADFARRCEEEGVIFKTLTNPTEILGYHNAEDRRDPKNGTVVGLKCVEMELGEPDASGRRRPVVKEGSDFEMEMDCVIMALGTSPNPLIKSTTKGLEINKRGGIIVNEDGLTTRDGIYAGGDAVTGAATVILAMGAGKTAAKAIDQYLGK